MLAFCTIIQSRDDKDFLKLFCKHLMDSGVTTQEQLDSRFDALALEFAIKHNGEYRPETKTLSFSGGTKTDKDCIN